jgi:hypothetical protein
MGSAAQAARRIPVSAVIKHHHMRYRRGELLDVVELGRVVHMSPTEITRLIAERRFPLPTVGHLPGCPLWLRDEIEEWRGKRWLARC